MGGAPGLLVRRCSPNLTLPEPPGFPDPAISIESVPVRCAGCLDPSGDLRVDQGRTPPRVPWCAMPGASGRQPDGGSRSSARPPRPDPRRSPRRTARARSVRRRSRPRRNPRPAGRATSSSVSGMAPRSRLLVQPVLGGRHQQARGRRSWRAPAAPPARRCARRPRGAPAPAAPSGHAWSRVGGRGSVRPARSRGAAASWRPEGGRPVGPVASGRRRSHQAMVSPPSSGGGALSG